MARRFSWIESTLERGGPNLRLALGFGMAAATGLLMVQALVGRHGILVQNTVASKSHAASMKNAMKNDACGIHNKALRTCLDNARGDSSKCQLYVDMLNQCRQGPRASTFALVKGPLLN